MNRYSGSIAVILVMAHMLPVCFTGCAGKKKEEKSDWYNAKTIDLELNYVQSEYDSLYSNFMGMIDDRILLSVDYQKPIPSDFDYSYGDYSLYQGTSIELYDNEGNYIKSVNCKDIAEKNGINGYIDKDPSVNGDKVIISYRSGNADDITIVFLDIETEEVVFSYKKTGELFIRETAFSDGYTALSYGTYGSYDSSMLDIIGSDGEVRSIELKSPEAVWNSSFPMIDTGDGRIIVPFNTTKKGVSSGIGFFMVDLKNASYSEADEDLKWLGNSDSLFRMSYKEGLGFLSSDEDGLFKVDLEKKQTERILDYDRANANLYLLRNMELVQNEGDRYIFGGNVYLAEYADLVSEPKLIVLEKSEEDPTAKKEEITLASFDVIDYATAEAVLRFNQSDSDYYISFDPQYYLSSTGVDIYEASEEEMFKAKMTLVDKLKVDILAGDGPDLIMNGFDFTPSIDTVVFADLTDDISAEGSFDNIFDACRTGGKLYTVPLTFNIGGICTSSSSVSAGQKGFTFDEYKEFVSTVCNGDDPILMDKSDYLINCFKLMSNEFMKDDGTPDFNSEEFRTLAEYINENVNFIDYTDDYDGYFEQIDEGNPAVYKYFNTIKEYLGYAGTLTDGITVLGIPSTGRHGPSVYVTDSVAVSSSAKNKTGCIGFIKMLLSDDIQEIYCRTEYVTPVNTGVYKSSARAMIEQNNDLREQMIGIGCDITDLRSMGLANEVGFDAVDDYEIIVRSCSVAAKTDPAIAYIVSEEIPAYFEGQKSIDQAIDIIINRTNTYLSERNG